MQPIEKLEKKKKKQTPPPPSSLLGGLHHFPHSRLYIHKLPHPLPHRLRACPRLPRGEQPKRLLWTLTLPCFLTQNMNSKLNMNLSYHHLPLYLTDYDDHTPFNTFGRATLLNEENFPPSTCSPSSMLMFDFKGPTTLPAAIVKIGDRISSMIVAKVSIISRMRDTGNGCAANTRRVSTRRAKNDIDAEHYRQELEAGGGTVPRKKQQEERSTTREKGGGLSKMCHGG